MQVKLGIADTKGAKNPMRHEYDVRNNSGFLVSLGMVNP